MKIFKKPIQKKFVAIVDQILQLKKDLGKIRYDVFTSPEFISKSKQLTKLNSQLNEMVYELYGLSVNEKREIKHLIPYT